MVIWIANQRVSVTVVDLFNDEMKDELWNLMNQSSRWSCKILQNESSVIYCTLSCYSKVIVLSVQ